MCSNQRELRIGSKNLALLIHVSLEMDPTIANKCMMHVEDDDQENNACGIWNFGPVS